MILRMHVDTSLSALVRGLHGVIAVGGPERQKGSAHASPWALIHPNPTTIQKVVRDSEIHAAYITFVIPNSSAGANS